MDSTGNDVVTVAGSFSGLVFGIFVIIELQDIYALHVFQQAGAVNALLQGLDDAGSCA